jgi:nitrate reductase NapD
MPISGVVIKCQLGRADELAATVNQVAGVDIRHKVDESALVAVIEAPTVSEEVELTKVLMSIDGVVEVQLAYHNFEDTDY